MPVLDLPINIDVSRKGLSRSGLYGSLNLNTGTSISASSRPYPKQRILWLGQGDH